MVEIEKGDHYIDRILVVSSSGGYKKRNQKIICNLVFLPPRLLSYGKTDI